MRVLVACEFSGRVRAEFLARGHDAYSCDLLPSEDGEVHRHFQQDVFEVLGQSWFDLLIAFPPCTYIANCGNKHYAKTVLRLEAMNFVRRLADADVKRIAIENPVGQLSTYWRKPDQIIQPWQFGHGETKATCLWLKNLPPLKPTRVVSGREQRVWKMAPSPTRAMDRSRTYPGIARAMARQWG